MTDPRCSIFMRRSRCMYQFKRQINTMTFQEKMDLIDKVRKEADEMMNSDDDKNEEVLLESRRICKKLIFEMCLDRNS